MDLDPAKAFASSAHAKAFYDMSASPALHAALQTALAVMQIKTTGKDAAANWQKLEGAKVFTSILLNLAEPPARKKVGVPHDNLNPQ